MSLADGAAALPSALASGLPPIPTDSASLVLAFWALAGLGAAVLAFKAAAAHPAAAWIMAAIVTAVLLAGGLGLEDLKRDRIAVIVDGGAKVSETYLKPVAACADSEALWSGAAARSADDLAILSERPECAAPLREALVRYLAVSGAFVAAIAYLLANLLALLLRDPAVKRLFEGRGAAG